MSKFIQNLCLAVTLFFLPGTIQSQSNLPQITRGAYLQLVTSNSIIIRWQTNIPSTSKVLFADDSGVYTTVLLTEFTQEHIVYLNGLKPNTRYDYRIGTATEILQGDSLNYFYTAPAPGTRAPLRIWATGDFGLGSSAQAAVRDAYTLYSDRPTSFWIWLGDNAYSTGTETEYTNFVFNMYPEQLKHFPLYPAPGNHDYAQSGYQSAASFTTNFPYFNIFTVPQSGEAGGIPSGTPKYYSYNYSNVHCISLDSYGSPNYPGSEMYKWLAADLAENTQQWTIVYFHHPPYSKGNHNSDSEIELIDMRTHIVPLLESFNVDLVLSGHSHTNERSYLIKGHYGNSGTFNSSMMMNFTNNNFIKKVPYEGTVYAVCGTSGQLADSLQPDGPMPCMYFNDITNYCSLVIDIDNENLSAKYLAASGVIIDEFTIYKPGPQLQENNGNASCDINYFPGSSTIFLSMYLSVDANYSAGIYDLNSKKLKDFSLLPVQLKSGYHVTSADLTNFITADGICLINVQIGKQIFSKKIFLRK